MSGPKVVRIVTRDELISICEGHLRRLDQAIAMWARDGKRIGELVDAEIKLTLERRHVLGALLAQDAFADLQKKVPDEIVYLSADLERRRQLAIDKLAQANRRQRRGQENASTLIKTLESRGAIIPAALRSLASGQVVEDADVVLAQGLALLTPQTSAGLTDAQRDLASSLLGGAQSGGAWKAAVQNPRIERVDRQIAELFSLLAENEAAEFSARLRALDTTAADAQQHLLLDSLIIDLAAVVTEARAQRTADAEVAMQDVNVGGDERFASSRRKAILQGLAQLGYDVHEGMETAWAKDGQVVAKKASLPGYGVEIGGQAHTGRLQVRTVALAAERDTTRDKDVETIWCSEFSRLQELLAEHGDSLVVERALGVGVVPLKVVLDTQPNVYHEPQSRTLS